VRFEVLPTTSALADALAVGRWIASHGAPLAAEQWVTELLRDLESLAELPNRHPLAPEGVGFPNLEIRHRLFGDYRIVFTIAENSVIVLHIRHGSRRPATTEELLARLAEKKDARG
jgi:toxin ParE1/3/4